MNINERLLKLRKEKGYSQEELANEINVSRQTISKWETGESNPDFDKIEPLCNLYGISADELIRGVKSEALKEEIDINEEKNEEILQKENVIVDNKYPKPVKKYEALVVSISLFLYFISIVWIIFIESLNVMSEELMVSIFLVIAAIPTCLLTYYYIAVGNQKRLLKEQAKINQVGLENYTKVRKYKEIDEIIALLFTIIYLFVSFVTGGWYITWILWIVYSLVIKIVHLILNAREEDSNEK